MKKLSLLAIVALLFATVVFAKPSTGWEPSYNAVFTGDLSNTGQYVGSDRKLEFVNSDPNFNDFVLHIDDATYPHGQDIECYLYMNKGNRKNPGKFGCTYKYNGTWYQLTGPITMESNYREGWFAVTADGRFDLIQKTFGADDVSVWDGQLGFTVEGTKI